ncbi:MAG: helix-turn-helix transcriptional regulator, partial [Ruminococcaceae bacterium]|nr:helix-turn-helix transcriptional regulator [Oscillospiraceae bacterium]
MTALSETIARLRKEKNVTQEAVAQAVGVSTQAVSKWENGGLPDVELLPAIADYFGVSVDMLFGREISAGNLEEAITRRFASMPEEDRMELAFQLAWVMERALFRPDEKDHDIAAIRASHKGGPQQYSRITLDSGFTQMGLAPLSYFLLVPENENFREKLTDGVDFTALFTDLAMPDVLDAFLLLYSRPTGKFFTAGLLE